MNLLIQYNSKFGSYNLIGTSTSAIGPAADSEMPKMSFRRSTTFATGFSSMRPTEDSVTNIGRSCSCVHLDHPVLVKRINTDLTEQTPNFAMSTEDVLQGGNAVRGQTGKRFTAQVFAPEMQGILGNNPSGSPVRLPAEMSDWPPYLLFESVYASTVVHHFGQPLKDKKDILFL